MINTTRNSLQRFPVLTARWNTGYSGHKYRNNKNRTTDDGDVETTFTKRLESRLDR